jgi:hypothetical protein
MRPERHEPLLTLVLLAALAAPVAASAMGKRLARPFGIGELALVALLAGLLVVHAALSGGAREWRRIALDAAVVVALAVPLAHLIRLRANAFYTSVALLEGIAFLLVLQLAARALRLVAARGARKGTPSPEALAAADHLMLAALVATAGMFVLAWVGYYEAAALSLTAAAGSVGLGALLRIDL